jgi:hypothetical protein
MRYVPIVDDVFKKYLLRLSKPLSETLPLKLRARKGRLDPDRDWLYLSLLDIWINQFRGELKASSSATGGPCVRFVRAAMALVLPADEVPRVPAVRRIVRALARGKPLGLFQKYAENKFKQLIDSYAWFNPHLSLRGVWFGREFINVKATNPNWEKWGPRNPTSPHWYDESRLQRYLAAHVARDRDLGQNRTVRQFIAEFRGLSGTAVQRKVLEDVGCSHQSLAQFFGVDQVNRNGIAKLLAAMRRHSKPVAPKHLGVIGVEHFKHQILATGGNIETFKYPTIEVGNYLHAMQEPDIVPAEFADAIIDIIGPSGNLSAVFFCEKEGVQPAVQDSEPRQPL